jgi:predicted glycosyltransferase
MTPTIKRILVYTHNSVGMGHAFRTLAVLTGIKRHRPDIDFLVLSGSSIPHLFTSHGIEAVKLPSIKKEVDKPGSPLRPRYLTSMDAQAVFDYRQRVILETFEFFSPDVVMVEHYLGGLMNEALPLIRRKPAGNRFTREWMLVHLSRGICPTLESTQQHSSPLSAELSAEAIDTARQFDLIYVLEDPGRVDPNHKFLGNIPDLRSKIHYLGPITIKTLQELPPRREIIRRLGLRDKRIILLSLGRHGPILQMAGAILSALRKRLIQDDCQIVMVLDPYLDDALAHTLAERMLDEDIRVLSFTPHLIDLINISELVICRAGYNIVNEVLLTGVASLVIPERHPGAEQEHRAKLIGQENIIAADENEIVNGALPSLLDALLSSKRKPSGNCFDKYAIGRRMLDDFENLRQLRQQDSSPREQGKS